MIVYRHKAKPGQCGRPASGLQALPADETGAGNLDYACSAACAPDTFVMRRGRDRTPSMPMSRCPSSGVYDARWSLLAEPLRLDF